MMRVCFMGRAMNPAAYDIMWTNSNLFPLARCHHLHLVDEEQSRHTGAGGVSCSGHRGAEHTAAMAYTVAIATSWAAVRTGIAPLRIHRLPWPDVCGDRRGWECVDPRATREWAMLPLAAALGLQLRLPGDTVDLPTRKLVDDVIETVGELPANTCYVGQGHHRHRLPRSKWSSPFIIGQHGTAFGCVALYSNYLRSSTLGGQVLELAGMTLLCDCPLEVPCVTDVLMSHFLEQKTQVVTQPSGHTLHPKANQTGRLLASLIGAVVTDTIPPTPNMAFPQVSVAAAFRKLYSAEWVEGLRIPFIDDLINSSPFTDFEEWRCDMGYPVDGPWGPALVQGGARYATRAALGEQQGAVNHKAALPPLLSYGLAKDAHFREALRAGSRPTPLEAPAMVDDDLRFAAAYIVKYRDSLKRRRSEALRAIAALQYRWQPVTAHLRRFAPSGVASVIRKRDVGLLGLFIVLLRWPDTEFARELLQGFPAIGTVTWCGAFPPSR